MSHTALILMAIVNAVLCCGVGVICMCRIKAMGPQTRLVFRGVYVAMLVGSLASALQSITPPLYTWPSWADISINAALLAWLWSGRHAWLKAPEYTTKPMPLDPEQLRHVAGGTKSP